MRWPRVVRLRRRRLVADEEGAVLVEVAIFIPVLALFLCAIVDFGLAIYTLNALTMAVREGGRYAAVLASPTASAAVQGVVVQAFNNMNVTAEALEAGDVDVTTNVCTVTVAIPSGRYAYRPIIPLADLLENDEIPMGRSATFRMEQASADCDSDP
jgi:Flp pilus assembly protein TadG